MAQSRLHLVGTRIASALVARARRYRDKLLAPDTHAGEIAAARQLYAAADLSDMVVVITGSSRGVGLALAEGLATAGARLVLNGRDPGRLERALRALRDAGADAVGLAADIGSPAGASRLIAAAIDAYGRVDVLVNNAGIAGPVNTKFWEIDAAQWDPVLAANAGAAYYCAREAMRWMVANQVAGRIVNVSSGAGRAAAPGMAPYVASKFALEGLTRAMAMDADGTGIAVCAIELGTLRTDMSRAITRFEDHQHLPPPETVLPVFLHALRAPCEQVSGRVYAAWRYRDDPEGEAVLAKSLASFSRFRFAPTRHGDRLVHRSEPGFVAFDRAENPLGMPAAVRELLRAAGASADLSKYPEESYRRLREALSEHTGLPAGDFTFGPGSADLVERVVRVFGGTGEDVICTDPTWFMFDRFCAMNEIALRKVPVRQRHAGGPYDHHLDAIAAAVGPRTRLVYLINPSNPLGNGIDRREFLAFLEALPPHVPVVVDEAYVEFSTNPEMLRTDELVRSLPADTERMLIGLRTFSKFYGLAGLRIGYAFGTPRAMRMLGRLEQLFCLSSLAEAAAVAALSDQTHAVATRELIASERQRMRDALAAAGIASLPSECHFMLVECPAGPGGGDETWGEFVDAGIIVPRGLMFDRWMMMPIGLPQHNDRHLAILAAIAARHAAPARASG
jgi:histidinol-phosphate aminotransferase